MSWSIQHQGLASFVRDACTQDVKKLFVEGAGRFHEPEKSVGMALFNAIDTALAAMPVDMRVTVKASGSQSGSDRGAVNQANLSIEPFWTY